MSRSEGVLQRLAGAALAVLVAWVVIAASGGAAQAGAFYLPERGARALSLGGAHIAGADDLNAQWLNPAGLVRLRGDWNLYLDVGLIFNEQSFQRAPDAEVMRKDPTLADGFPNLTDDGNAFVDPSLGVASNFGLDDWMFAFGAYGPYAGTNEWDPDGPQRYSVITLAPTQLFIQLSAAWRINDYVAVGAGFQWIFTSVKQRLAISAYPGVFGWAEQRDLDTLAEVDVHDIFTPSGNLGVIVTPVEFMDIGVSVQAPAKAEAEGTLKVRLPASFYFQNTSVSGDQIGMELQFPWIFRLGLRFYEEDLWSVELATVVEMWSALSEIPVRPGAGGIAFEDVPGIGTYSVKPFDVRLDHEDIYSLRLGGSYTPMELLTLRAGAFYEVGSVPTRTMTVLGIDLDKIGLTFGGSLNFGAVTLDLSFAYLLFSDETVTDSIRAQVNPLYDTDPSTFGESGPHIVGNGTYTRSVIIAATSLGVAF